MPTEPVIEVAGVTKTFAGIKALDGVDFTLHQGSIHALVGENGAGKSTLIKVLTGIHQPDGGEVRRAGRISTIYQEVNLIPLMSVAANLFLGREPRTRFGLIDRAKAGAEARRILEGYGITADVSQPLGTLSVGEQQMVALARAVETDADVVIMDEPTSSLEPREVETLFQVVERLHERNIAIVYVSHRMDELYRICDTVTVLRDGKKVHSGPLGDLPRIELVSLMLGRSVSDIKAGGTTAFGEDHHAGKEPVLEANDLTSRPRLNGVNVTIRPGEVVGLAGLLGSGRTETAKAIIGAIPTQHGNVLIAGKTVPRGNVKAAMRAGISMLAEDRKAEGIIPHLSVRENIVLAALPGLSRFGLVSRAKQDRIVDLFIKRLRIKVSSPEQRVAELSGGNQQKVLLARWLCAEPKVLLLDEPTRGIDVGAKAEVQALIDELAKEGLAVLLISSELDELLDGADRLVVLRDGHVAGELTGGELTCEHVLAAIAAEPEPAGVSDDADRH
ncbi:sugar ABC transporter ATP-binding protein [Lentzea guizhouensis]|uniref:Sugar ABC transporter ATP-binding protein n=1 Tax=Lentzea guizhouensis TaxID=1586287 RepID=A0A1B2HVX5_9PSEU|nr:sugar ABC transporter ATP-binding protein [Lentzea guizhouensis]ANZ41889.1 sugar ABC transporter ATP-binding protein [Lentzea guizhouensis]